MDKFTNSKWFYRILALFFALLLFFNANHSLDNNSNAVSTINTTDLYQEELKKVPIDFKYNSQKYYLTPSVSSIDVNLESQNKVLIDTEANSQTRQMKVVADLENKGPGTYTVPLKIRQLNGAVKAKLQIRKVRVKIEPKEIESFNIKAEINDDEIAKGYQVKKIILDPKSVKVTTGKNQMNKIKKVVAEFPSDEKLSQTTTKKVGLKAYDAYGNELNVKFSVPIVSMTVQITSSTKTVPINLMQKGTMPSGIESYQFLCDTQTVDLSGAKDDLSKIKGIDANIDISEITKTETKKIALQIPEGVKSDIKNVTVTIVPLKVGEKPMDIQKSTN